MKPQIISEAALNRAIYRWSQGRNTWALHKNDLDGLAKFYCPYGQVGDRLWVRETFGILSNGQIAYRANCDEWHDKQGFRCKWHPSIFMKRKDSRITLEITGIRVERLQDISQNDAVAEGLLFLGGMADNWDEAPWADPTDKEQTPFKYPTAAYGHLWDSINKRVGHRWTDNPWCWAIDFRKA